MRQFETTMIGPDKLRELGIDVELCGITGRKARPYMIVTVNGHMSWLLPLTTQIKGKHGRISVSHKMFGKTLDCEAITTDMIAVFTPKLNEITKPMGMVVAGGDAVLDQIVYSIKCGRLGVYPGGRS